jgi:hypothetical protein
MTTFSVIISTTIVVQKKIVKILIFIFVYFEHLELFGLPTIVWLSQESKFYLKPVKHEACGSATHNFF